MKIQLAPGEKLHIGLYIRADQQEESGWSPRQDQETDGSFLIDYTADGGLTIRADLEDDDGRGGGAEPIIYHVGCDEPNVDADVAQEDKTPTLDDIVEAWRSLYDGQDTLAQQFPRLGELLLRASQS